MLHQVNVFTNITLLGNLTFQFNPKIDLIQHNQGLATSGEWETLDETIRFSGIKQALSEDLTYSLCLDSEHCTNTISGVAPPPNFNPASIRILTPDQIRDKLSLGWWGKIKEFLKPHAAEICLLSLLVQFFIFIVQIVDFIFGNNEQNIIRLFLRAIIRIVVIMVRCCCTNKNKRNHQAPVIRNEDNSQNMIEMSPLVLSPTRAIIRKVID